MKKILGALVGFVGMCAFLFTLLVPSMSSAASTADIQAQINSLLATIQSLQQQLAQQQNGSTAFCHTFSTNLGIDSHGPEVDALRSVLVRQGFLSDTQLGMSDRFDEVTASSVSAFQEKYRADILTPNGLAAGTGYVGASTRAKLNTLYGCGSPLVKSPLTQIAPPYISSIESAANPVSTLSAGEKANIHGVGLGGSLTIKIGVQDVQTVTTVGLSEGYAEFVVPTRSQSAMVSITVTNNTTGLTSAPYQVTITVPTTPTADVKISGSDGPVSVKLGDTINLMWSSSNASYCMGSGYALVGTNYGGWGTTRLPVTGTEFIKGVASVGANLTFGLQCWNANGVASSIDTVRANIIPATVTAPTLAVTYPNGGETWNTNTTQYISWTSQGIDLNRQIGVYLHFLDGGLCNVGLTTVGALSLNVSIPPQCNGITRTIVPGQYTAFVTVGDQTGTDFVAKDDSNAPFTIAASATQSPTITLITPNGGDTIVAGQTFRIQWTSSGLGSDSINIVLANSSGAETTNIPSQYIQQGVTASLGGGVTGSYLTYPGLGAMDNKGGFSWTVPSNIVPGSSYYICVTQSRVMGVQDCSDRAFKITSPAPTLSSLSTNSAVMGTQISVNGTNFAQDTYLVMVGSNGASIAIMPTQITPTSMMFAVPTNISAGTYTVKVGTKGSSAELAGSLTLTVTAPASVTYNNTIQGYKVLVGGTWPPSESSVTAQAVTLDGVSGGATDPYYFTSVASGSHTLSVNPPTGWTVTHTRCLNPTGQTSSANCVNNEVGNSYTVTFPSDKGYTLDLWWNFTAPASH